MKKLATALLVSIIIVCLMGALIPQSSLKSPQFMENWKRSWPKTFTIVHALQLDRVFSSLLFVFLLLLFLCVLGYLIYLQLRSILRTDNQAAVKNMKPEGSGWLRVPISPERDFSEIRSFIVKKGYREICSYDMRAYFVKNRMGRYGSILFHSGILIIVIAGIWYACFHKRGFVQLIHGDTFSGREEDFTSTELGLLQREFNLDFLIHFENIEHKYWENNELKDLRSYLLTGNRKDGIKGWEIAPNKPIKYRGIRIYQSYYYGYTLSFKLIRDSGDPIFCHFSLDMPGSVKKPLIGISEYPLTPYIFKMEFHPDETHSSFYLNRPYLKLSVFTERGEIFFNGIVHPGGEVNLGKDRLIFSEIRRWSGVIFSYFPGEFMVWLGFGLSTGGLFLIYFLPFKRLYCILERGDGMCMLYMKGFSARFNALFRVELEALKDEVMQKFNERAGGNV